MRSYFNLCFFSFYTQHPRQIILQSYTDLELTLIIITASLVIKGIKGSLSICCNLATVFSSVIKIMVLAIKKTITTNHQILLGQHRQ